MSLFGTDPFVGKTIARLTADTEDRAVEFTFSDGTGFRLKDAAFSTVARLHLSWARAAGKCFEGLSRGSSDSYGDYSIHGYRLELGGETSSLLFYVYGTNHTRRDLRLSMTTFEKEMPWTKAPPGETWVIAYAPSYSETHNALSTYKCFSSAKDAYLHASEALGYSLSSIAVVGPDFRLIGSDHIFIRPLVWQDREAIRLCGHTCLGRAYTELPWVGLTPVPGLFAHLAEKDARLVAFTENDAKGAADIQLVMKPGRYLKKFYPLLSDKEILRYAEWLVTGSIPRPVGLSKLDFARTPEAIEALYIEGPDSCMSGKAKEFTDDDGTVAISCHPARVYGAGDLAVAYMMRGGKVVARGVVNLEKKTYVRLYPTPERWQTDGFMSHDDAEAHKHALATALLEEGYVEGSIAGARLLAIREKRGWLMPYVDGYYSIERMATAEGGKRVEYFRLREACEHSSSYDIHETKGYMDEPYDPWYGEDEDEDEDEDDRVRDDDAYDYIDDNFEVVEPSAPEEAPSIAAE